MPRGGRRAGSPGKAYSNRSDLTAAPRPVPIAAAPGQPYGAAKSQLDSQRAVPMGNAPLNAPGAGAPSPVPPGAGQGGASSPVGLPPGLPEPGSMPPITAPTARPDEHLMTGVPQGPGAGPEALNPVVIHPLVQGVALLNSLGSSVSPQVKILRDQINAQLANQAAP